MKHMVIVVAKVRRLHSPEIVSRFFTPVVIDAENEEAILSNFAKDLSHHETYDAKKENYQPPAVDGEAATRMWSDKLVEVLHGKAPGPVAGMALLDAAVRVVKTSNENPDDVAAIDILMNTLSEIRKAIQG